MVEGWRHGSSAGYRSAGCRCIPCTEAHRQRQRRNTARAVARGPLPADDPRHGTQSSYTYYRCRCEACRAANAAASAAYRATR